MDASINVQPETSVITTHFTYIPQRASRNIFGSSILTFHSATTEQKENNDSNIS